MSAETFVQLARTKGLLNANRFEKVMRQIKSANKPISAERIATLLVNKSIISSDEAKQILAEMASETTRRDTVTRDTTARDTPLPVDDDSPLTIEPLEAELELIDDAPPAKGSGIPVAELEEVNAIFTGSSRAMRPPVSEDLLGAELLDEIEPQVATGGRIKSRKKGLLARLGLGGNRVATRPKGNRWDSPLMLVGGGTLLLLLIGGSALGWFLTRETGEEVFATAEEDYRAQKYTNAISKFERFAEKFPSHPKVSIARVRASMSKIRQGVESGNDWDRALETTTKELLRIKSEEAFNTEARPDLSRLLPAIYAGFVDAAGKIDDPAEKQLLLDKSQQALALIDNPEYLPGSLRKTIERDIEKTDEKAAVIIREINRDKELTLTVARIKQLTASQDTVQAYAARDDLLSRYPALATHPDLIAAIREITTAERAKVTLIDSGPTAETTDHAVALKTRVILADRTTKKQSGLNDRSVFVVASGALYGLDANDGSVLWRRWLGYANRIHPQSISGDALVFDDARQELLRVAARDGKLVWRLPFGEAIAAPVVDGDRIGVATHSGKLLWANGASGSVNPIAQLPQQLSVEPTIDPQSGRIYQVGQHSSLYILSANTLACDEVAYIGHHTDSVRIPALSVAGHVVVIENGGDFAWLHVLAGDKNGLNLRPVRKIRLDSEVNVPMQRFGRRLLVVTDLGALHIYDVDAANTTDPIREVAKTLPTDRERRMAYPLIESGQVFIADNKLSRYEFQSSRGELVRKWVADSHDIYVAPPQIVDDVIFSSRRNVQSTATEVTAFRTAVGQNQANEGELLWSTKLGAAPAMPVRYDKLRRAITVVSSDGGIWDIGGSHVTTGRLDELASKAVGITEPVFMAAELADEQTVLVPNENVRQMVVINPTAQQRFQVIPVAISAQNELTKPVALGNELLLGSSSGSIHAITTQGVESVLPFLPTLNAGSSFHWLPPAVVDADSHTFVAANDDGAVYLIATQATPKPHLAATKSVSLDVRLVQNLAVVSGQVLAVVRTSAGDELRAIRLPQLDSTAGTPIDGRVVWGPHAINGEITLLVTSGHQPKADEQNQIVAVGANAQIVWTAPMLDGALAGDPLTNGNTLILTSMNGQVWQMDATTGATIPWSANATHLDVGEPLGAGASVFSNRLLLLGRDCTLFMTEMPESQTAAN